MRKRVFGRDIWRHLVLAAIITIFFWRFFVFGDLPLPGDIITSYWPPWSSNHVSTPTNPLLSDCVNQFYPLKDYSYQILKEKRTIPSWNPYNFCGTSMVSFSTSFFLRPTNYLTWVLQPPMSYALGVILQSFFAGLFMYFFLRNLNVSSFGSLVGSTVFMLNGVFIVWLEFETTVGGGLWFPLVFLLLDKTVTRGSIIYPILVSIILALQVFSLHLQFSLYLLISSFIYAFFRIFMRYKDTYDLRGLLKGSGLIVIIFISGISLSMVHLFPTFNQAGISHRKEFMLEELNPLPVANLVTFVVPDFYGTPAPPHTYSAIRGWFYKTGLIKERVVRVGGENYNEYCGYIGVLPLVLALLAGLLRKDRDSRFFFWFWIVSLLLALGTFLYLPLYWFAPGFNKMGISRIIFLFCFSGSVLAGMGVDHLIEGRRERTVSRREGAVIRITVLVLLLATIGWLVFLLIPKFNTQPQTPISQLLSWHFSLKNPSMSIPILLVLSSIIILILSLRARGGINPILIKGAIFVVVSFDLLYFGMKYNPMTPKEWLFPKTPSLSFLTDKLDKEPPFRIVAFGRILPPNTNLIYRLQSVEGYESLHSARYHDFMKELVSPDIYHNWVDIISWANRRILQLLNVRYILANVELKGEDLRLIYDGEIRIYEDLGALPRAWIVPEAKILKRKEEIFDELRSPGFDPRRTVILEEKPDELPITDYQLPIKIRDLKSKIVEYQPEKVIIEASLPNDGFLVLSDSWDPGWRVFVDGKERKVLRANYIMRAVRLWQGDHLVEFIYDPPSFKIGLYISIATSLVIILIFGYTIFKKIRGKVYGGTHY